MRWFLVGSTERHFQVNANPRNSGPGCISFVFIDIISADSLGLHLLTWFNVNPTIIYIPYELWDQAVEVRERVSNFISHFTERMITYPCQD